MNFKEKYNGWIVVVNDALGQYIAEKDTPEGNIYKAMKYSLTAGGKRLRPVLALAVCELLNGKISTVLPYACAIEMIHTYSLIHDDLPAMDDDDYRRGRPTNHKVFGEAMAVLAGDGLLNRAFEIMLADMCSGTQDARSLSRKARVAQWIAKASGTSGMIGGQVVDLESEGKTIPAELLEYMHRCKTGALIKAPVVSAAILCGALEDEFKNLEEYAAKLGLAFQIKDDILDIEGNLESMGKAAGSDAAKMKSTFITLYGLEGSKKMLENITNQAISSLEIFGAKAEFLVKLAEYLVRREN